MRKYSIGRLSKTIKVTSHERKGVTNTINYLETFTSVQWKHWRSALGVLCNVWFVWGITLRPPAVSPCKGQLKTKRFHVMTSSWWPVYLMSYFGSSLLNSCWSYHYCHVIVGAVASQITSLTIVYSTAYSDADQRKHQSSASLAFVRGIYRGPVNSPYKWLVTRKMFPFDDVIMWRHSSWSTLAHVVVCHLPELSHNLNHVDVLSKVFSGVHMWAFLYKKWWWT